MGFEKRQAYSPERAVHGTVKDTKKKNSLMWALINVVVCCNKEHMKMDVL